jgi:hypothetical protein
MIIEYGMYGNRQDQFELLATVNQTEIIEYCHAIANLMNAAKDITREIERAEVVKVTSAGLKITRGMIEDEIACTRMPREVTFNTGPMPQVIGLNASSNQFA